MQIIEGRDEIQEKYSAYLCDESRLTGKDVLRIYFPESIEDVQDAMRGIAERNECVVISGARTGILGGSVPQGAENLLSLDRIRRDITIGCDKGEWYATVSAGHRIEELARYLADAEYQYCGSERTDHRLYYPVDPTETTASIGGMIATNASGARTYGYGPTRDWVRRITVVLVTGERLDLCRGEYIVAQGVLTLPNGLQCIIPTIKQSWSKNTAGYYLRDGMDAVDLFIGSEGTLGIVVEAELCLIDMPHNMLAQVIYFSGDDSVVSFLTALRKEDTVSPVAIEYFDDNALDLLIARRQEEGSGSQLPKIPAHVNAALYIEHVFQDDEELDVLYAYYEKMFKLLNISEDMTWAAFDAKEIARMKLFRHAVPEAINTIVSSRKKQCADIYKISTDMAVCDGDIKYMLSLYKKTLVEADIEYIIFGHIGDNHVHVNMLPRNSEELQIARDIYHDFAKTVIKLGGTISAEHGIGRLKKDLLTMQYSSSIIEAMKSIKAVFDPYGRLNPGILF